MTQNIHSTLHWEDLTPKTPQTLSWQLTINVWAEVDEIVEFLVKYGARLNCECQTFASSNRVTYTVVSNADLSASYDIRADTQNPGNNLVILYKATITQSTGEVNAFRPKYLQQY